MSLLEVEGLRVRLPTTRGLVTVVDGVDYAVEHGRGVRRRGRERQRQDDVDARRCSACCPTAPSWRGACASASTTCCACRAGSLREVAGRELAMVFQDPLTSLHPMLSIGRQLTEHVRRHLGLGRREAERHALASLADVRIPDPGLGAARVPAPVLRRHAPADRDRDRARVPAQAADRRRADDGARRDGAGRDPAAARPPAPRERPVGHPDHARPRRDVGDRRPRVDLLRGQGRRGGLARGRPAHAAPSVHARAARCAASPGGLAGQAAGRDRRRSAEPGRDPVRLLLPSPLPLRAGELRARCSAARRERRPAARLPGRPAGRRDERARGSRRRRRLRGAAAAAACARSRARA